MVLWATVIPGHVSRDKGVMKAGCVTGLDMLRVKLGTLW